MIEIRAQPTLEVMNRREFFATATVTSIAALSGCLGGNDGGSGDSNDSNNTTDGQGNGSEPLTAAFDWEPTEPETGEEVVFNASASTGEIAEYRWEFGDDSEITSQETSVTHTFTEAGNRSVELTLEDGTGETDTQTEEVVVELSAEDELAKVVSMLVQNATVLENILQTEPAEIDSEFETVSGRLDMAESLLSDIENTTDELAEETDAASEVVTFQRLLLEITELYKQMESSFGNINTSIEAGMSVDVQLEELKELIDELRTTFNEVETVYSTLTTSVLDEPTLSYDEPLTTYLPFERSTQISGAEALVDVVEQHSKGVQTAAEATQRLVSDGELRELENEELETTRATVQSGRTTIETAREMLQAIEPEALPIFSEFQQEDAGEFKAAYTEYLNRFIMDATSIINAIDALRDGREDKATEELLSVEYILDA
jgi:PKD repeat protein